MPVPVDMQCQLFDRLGVKCTRINWAIMTRADGSTLRLCDRHAVNMREQIATYPERFAPVRFSIIEK